ncbi:MAG: NifB/NifX family molybdenum-iron cluster-binding protein [Deltaproteobacteria bacterium]|nr:NifB/NifX family molybdenum-iron cluster-binding protein [Deltaproteobacteria bacterium]
MKIALPSRDREVDGHFGHCDHFTVFTVDGDRQIVAEETFAPPPGCGCKSNVAQTLAGMGVEVLPAGNMGEGAARHLGSHGIRVVRGCAGSLREVAEGWLAGRVQDSRITCDDHGSCSHG